MRWTKCPKSALLGGMRDADIGAARLPGSGVCRKCYKTQQSDGCGLGYNYLGRNIARIRSYNSAAVAGFEADDAKAAA